MVSPQCVFSGGLSDDHSGKNICHIGCIDMVSPQCVFSGGLSVYTSGQNICHICCIDMASPHCVLSIKIIFLWENLVTLAALIWFLLGSWYVSSYVY